MERLQGPQDYSGMQAQTREQGQGGQRALLLALAAQEAGKEFAPVQGAFLKRAMEARQPMSTATGTSSPRRASTPKTRWRRPNRR